LFVTLKAWRSRFSGIKKPRPRPGFFAFRGFVASLISSAENTRPEPAGTAAAAAADIFAGDEVHEPTCRMIESARL
jgi:hypothetical protein